MIIMTLAVEMVFNSKAEAKGVLYSKCYNTLTFNRVWVETTFMLFLMLNFF